MDQGVTDPTPYPGLAHAVAEPAEKRWTEITQIGRWTYRVQLKTSSLVLGSWITTELLDPPHVPGRRWARWKARRMLAAEARRDERRRNTQILEEC